MFSQLHPSDMMSQVDALHTKGCKKTFYCQICLLELNSEDTMMSHNRGSKHMKKLRELESKGLGVEQPIFPIRNPLPTRKKVPSYLMDKIRENSNPVVGLDFVKEFVPVSNSEMEPHYECSLCDSQGQANGMFCHLMGQKHRRNFLNSLYGHTMEANKLTPAQLRELVMMYDERKNIIGRIATINSDTSYPWPHGKEPWNIDNGGTGIAPDDARSNYGKFPFKVEEKHYPLRVKSPSPCAHPSGKVMSRPQGPKSCLDETSTSSTPGQREQSFRPDSYDSLQSSVVKDPTVQRIQAYKKMLDSGRKILMAVADFKGSAMRRREQVLLGNCLRSIAFKLEALKEGKFSNSRLLPAEASVSKESLAVPAARSMSESNTLSRNAVRKNERFEMHGRFRSRSPIQRMRSPSSASSSIGSTISSSSTRLSPIRFDSESVVEDSWRRRFKDKRKGRDDHPKFPYK